MPPQSKTIEQADLVMTYVADQLNKQFMRYVQKAQLIRIPRDDFLALRIAIECNVGGFEYDATVGRHRICNVPCEPYDGDAIQFLQEIPHFL